MIRQPLPLLKHQETGAAFLAARERAGLFDEPGVGKTAQAIGAMDKAGIRSALVICPASAREVWRGEFKKFARLKRSVMKCRDINDVNLWLRSKVDVLILSYEHAKKWAKVLSGDLIECIVFDEAHYLKSDGSQRTRAMLGTDCDGRHGLAGWGIHVWFLTGTPMPNDPSDIWPFLRFARGTKLTQAAFRRRYFHARQLTYGMRCTPRKEMADELALAQKAVSLRRTKAQAEIHVPPIWITTTTIDGDTAAVRNLLAEWPGLEQSILQAVEQGGLSFLDAQHIATLRRLVGEAKAPAYLDLVADELAASGEKLVILGLHKVALRTIADGLTARGFPTVMLTGDTPERDRGPVVKRFQEDPAVKVFVGNLRAAGTAITLTASAQIDLFESSWAPADNAQGLMRVHRIGQTRKVRGRMISLANSIDETVTEVVAQKTAAIAMIEQR